MPDIYRASVRGAARSARNLRAATRVVHEGLKRELRELGVEAKAVFWQHAPKDTGEFADSIETRFSTRVNRPGFTLTIDSDKDGFDLLPVSRFGHNTTIIYPDDTREGMSTAKGKAHAPALAVHIDGRMNPPIYRASVSGFFPGRDWVEDASWEVDELADEASDRLGRRIDRSIR